MPGDPISDLNHADDVIAQYEQRIGAQPLPPEILAKKGKIEQGAPEPVLSPLQQQKLNKFIALLEKTMTDNPNIEDPLANMSDSNLKLLVEIGYSIKEFAPVYPHFFLLVSKFVAADTFNTIDPAPNLFLAGSPSTQARIEAFINVRYLTDMNITTLKEMLNAALVRIECLRQQNAAKEREASIEKDLLKTSSYWKMAGAVVSVGGKIVPAGYGTVYGNPPGGMNSISGKIAFEKVQGVGDGFSTGASAVVDGITKNLEANAKQDIAGEQIKQSISNDAREIIKTAQDNARGRLASTSDAAGQILSKMDQGNTALINAMSMQK